MNFIRKLLVLLVLAASLSADGAAASAPSSEIPTILLEKAPGELGEFSGSGLVFLATDPGSREAVYLFDVGSRTAYRFAEKDGDLWDRVAFSEEPFKPVRRIRVHDGEFFALGGGGVKVYGPDGGREHSHELFQPRDLLVDDSELFISLTNVPHPAKPDRFLGRDRFHTSVGVPRIVELDLDDFDLAESGLLVNPEGMTASEGAGRAPRLAGDGGSSVFAAEFSNYVIYELDRRLSARRTLVEPEIAMEQPSDEDVAQKKELAARLESEAKEKASNRGEDLARGSRSTRQDKSSGGPRAITFHNKPVINDLAWEPSIDRLLLLLQPGIVGRGPGLDLIEPETGQVRRFSLFVPGGGALDLNQIAVGERYVWLRDKRKGGTVYRFARTELQTRGGAPYEIPEVTGP